VERSSGEPSKRRYASLALRVSASASAGADSGARVYQSPLGCPRRLTAVLPVWLTLRDEPLKDGIDRAQRWAVLSGFRAELRWLYGGCRSRARFRSPRSSFRAHDAHMRHDVLNTRQTLTAPRLVQQLRNGSRGTLAAFRGRAQRPSPNLGDGWVMARLVARCVFRNRPLIAWIYVEKFGAGERFRTVDLVLGKHTLYQLSYTRS
jgi:hypothetical protein